MAPVAVLGAREDGEPLLVHAWSRLPIRTAATPPRRPLAPPQPPRGAALSILYRAPKKTSADQIRLNGSRGERIACGGGAQKQTYPGPTIAFHRALLPAAGSKIVPQNRKPFNMSARAFAGECEGRLGLTSPAPPPALRCDRQVQPPSAHLSCHCAGSRTAFSSCNGQAQHRRPSRHASTAVAQASNPFAEELKSTAKYISQR